MKKDIIIINLNKPHLCPVHNIYSTLAYSVDGGDVETSIIDGNIVMENRIINGVNEEEVLNECARIKRRLFS